MRQLALTLLSALVAFAQTQQVSSGINSPNVANVGGSVTITIYTCVVDSGWLDGPRATFTGTSTYSTTLPSVAGTIGASSMFTGTGNLPFQTMAAGTSTTGVTIDFQSFGQTPVLASSILTGAGDLLPFQKVADRAESGTNGLILAGTSIGGVTVNFQPAAQTPVLASSIFTAAGDLSPLQDVAYGADSHTSGFILAGTSAGSATLDWSASAKNSLASSSIITATGDLSPLQNVAYGTDSRTSGFILTGTSAGSATLDWSAGVKNSWTSNSIITATADLSPLQNVAYGTDSRTSGFILTGTSARSAISDWSAGAKSSLASSSIITGTDYRSLSKSLADLTARGNTITGWTLLYTERSLQ